MATTIKLDTLMETIRQRSTGEDEFLQAVEEVYGDIVPFVNNNKDYRAGGLLQRLSEPDRTISFRVVWEDDRQNVHVNRGYRVQFNSAIGPYKGGLRFHPSVNQSILKFLGFEQTFKNALTGLPMGGGKGGADFDPSGCSDSEIMRFCQSFMLELHRHIQPDIDVPAGDINVGAREIGYLFGAYKRITNEFEGVLTGKGLSFGGSEMRTEATGFGVVYFLHEILKQAGASIEDQTVVVSGAGNVATFAAQKAVDLGARVVTLSDSNGFIHDKEGITSEKIQWVRAHKAKPGSSLEAYADEYDARWHAGKSPWQVECDVALPCATQNELDEDAARTLAENNCKYVAEGANMPTTAGAKKVFRDAGILRGPAKAANAGGVAVSGLEISQNRTGRSRSRTEVQEDLCQIMKSIHEACLEYGEGEGGIDYARGANIAAFKKVADAMMAQGIG